MSQDGFERYSLFIYVETKELVKWLAEGYTTEMEPHPCCLDSDPRIATRN